MTSRRHPFAVFSRVAAAGLATVGLASIPGAACAQQFASGAVSAGLSYPTSLQFGPDGRLYASEQTGGVRAYSIVRNDVAEYVVTATEFIDLVKTGVSNHDDDGGPCSASCDLRQVTGILVAGSAATPVLYVSSSDSRIAVSNDSGLDTNSGVISRLRCVGGVVSGQCQSWEHVQIVRGLPRSEENHAVNGMALDAASNTLYLAVGGQSNKGAPGSAFSGTPEYYLSGAVLSIDLDAIAAIEAANAGPYIDARNGAAFVYDLPTLDDPTRGNIDNSDSSFPYGPAHPWHALSIDVGDPFGGNNSLNQAIPEPGGPVQVYSPGYRNPYDVLVTESGELFTWDNGPNSGWGGTPFVYSSAGVRKGYISQSPTLYDPDAGDYCSNEYNESGATTIGDVLKRISGPGYYGGHPAPTRAFPTLSGIYLYIQNASGQWVQDGPTRHFVDLLPAGFGLAAGDFADDARQCDHTTAADALETVSASTNGLTEYTSSVFDNAMHGDLLAAAFDGNIYRCKRSGAGLVDLPGSAGGATQGNCEVLFGGLSSIPLDIHAVGDHGPFPGTIWVVQYLSSQFTVYEPLGAVFCDPSDPAADADGDGYSNGDEQDTASDPCSPASTPADFDGDKLSDQNDPDDDNDGVTDVVDAFALDAQNGLGRALPLFYPLFNNDPGSGLFGIGFTGLALPGDGSTWRDLFDSTQLTAGGAAGRLTIEQVSAGEMRGPSNALHNGFQLGIAADTATPPFVVQARMVGPWFEVGGSASVPLTGQVYGLTIGSGDQDNYLRVGINAHASGAGIQVVRELDGIDSAAQFDASQWGGVDLLAATSIDLQLAVDPQALTARPWLVIDGGNAYPLGAPLAIPASWLAVDDGKGLALGVFASSGGAASFGASWDHLAVQYGVIAAPGAWNDLGSSGVVRHEHGFVRAGDRFYLIGGREGADVRIFDPATGNWSIGAAAPVTLHHVQAVAIDGLIHVVGGFVGACCDETPLDRVYFYDPVADRWIDGPQIPAARRRGAAGAVAVDGQVYLVGGNPAGHYGPASVQVDRYDPASGRFTALADAPQARDHFQLVHHEGRLYAVAGRDSNAAIDGDVLDDTVVAVDVYEIATDQWSTLPASAQLPTPRAGNGAGMIGNELIVVGGESRAQSPAHDQTEAFDVTTQAWRVLAPLPSARHGFQAITANGGLYVAAGAANAGGADGVLAVESLHLSGVTAPGGSAIAPASLSVPTTLAFGEVAVGSGQGRRLSLTNSGSQQALVIESLGLDGDASFALQTTLDGPRVLAPGASFEIGIDFAPGSDDAHSATLTVTHSGGSTQAIALSGAGYDPARAEVLWRINVGGAELAAADGTQPAWSADSVANPSPLRVAGGESIAVDGDSGSYSGPIVMEDDSLAASAPSALFQSGRWDPASAPEMRWEFPVQAGASYQVRLCFAELYAPVNQPGLRVFDVAVDGNVPAPFDAIDAFAQAGAKGAFMRASTVIAADATLDLEFRHRSEHPALKGIEILRIHSAENVAPTARDDHGVFPPGGQVDIAVLGNDADSDGSLNTASVAVVEAPLQGSVSQPSPGVLRYTPVDGDVWVDRFSYRVSDTRGDVSNIAVVRVKQQEAALAADHDGDGTPNAADTDDDNDSLPDTEDPFALDADNGMTTALPVLLPLRRLQPGHGLFGLGFSGVMTDGAIGRPGADYATRLDVERLFVDNVPGVSGALTLVDVGAGDALGGADSQRNALQFGIAVEPGSPALVASTTLLPPYFSDAPQAGQTQGLQLGDGSQRNFLKLALAGDGALQFVLEVNDQAITQTIALPDAFSAPHIGLFLLADPASATARALYSLDNGLPQAVGDAVVLPVGWFDVSDGIAPAVGLIASAGNSAAVFNAHWGAIEMRALLADDAFALDEDSPHTVLDVLANDGAFGIGLALSAVDTPDLGGEAEVDDRGTPANPADDVVRYRPATDAVGVETLVYTVQAADVSSRAVAAVDVLAVNDAPDFTLGGALEVPAGATGEQLHAGFASGFTPGGGSDEAGQQVAEYQISVDAPALFAAGPTLDATGTLRFTPAAGAAGTATLNVRVRDDGGTARGGVDLSAARATTITFAADVDIAITLQADRTSVVAGSTVQFTATVHNLGSSAASGVGVHFTLPAGLSMPITSGCAADPQGVPQCSIGALSAGAQTAITLHAQADASAVGSTLTLVAAVAADQPDGHSGNDSANVSVRVNAIDPTRSADVGVNLSASGSYNASGGDLVYVIDGYNVGPTAVDAATLSFPLPPKIASATWTCGSSGNAVCPTAGTGAVLVELSLPVDGSVRLQLAAKVATGSGGPIITTASITLPAEIDDPDIDNNQSTHTAMPQRVFRDGFEGQP